MSTKTCKRCGWVYPITQPGTRCKFCGEPFELVKCNKCGKVLPRADIKNNGMCRPCHNKINAIASPISKKKRKRRLTESFDEWVRKAKAVPTNYPTLTEVQWLEACKFFDGCARCYDENIDTRGFFISRVNGGRYCDWNIIPLCERCAKVWKLDSDMFNYTLKKGCNEHKYSEYRLQLQRIVEYLEAKLDKAITYKAPDANLPEEHPNGND